MPSQRRSRRPFRLRRATGGRSGGNPSRLTELATTAALTRGEDARTVELPNSGAADASRGGYEMTSSMQALTQR
jgi:hypothetical protein